MKKRLLFISFFLIIFFLVGCTSSSINNIEEESSYKQPREGQCPFGIHDDPYPGDCPHYEDQDQDGICDLSF